MIKHRQKKVLVLFALLFIALTSFIPKIYSDKQSLSLKKKHLYFSLENLKEFRIYYDQGSVKDSLSVRNRFAVSGDSSLLASLQLDSLLAKVFKTLRVIQYESKKEEDFGMWGKKYSWKPETISIRWKYKDDNNFYMIHMIYAEPEGIKTRLGNYFVINIGATLNNQTVYYYNKEKSEDIPGIMESLIRKDYGTNYEKNP